MKIVIQCAAKKHTHAGFMKTRDGKNVMFVAAPELIQLLNNYIYQTPEMIAEDGLSWRQKVLQYNKKDNNPFNLLPAHKLYVNSVRKIRGH